MSTFGVCSAAMAALAIGAAAEAAVYDVTFQRTCPEITAATFGGGGSIGLDGGAVTSLFLEVLTIGEIGGADGPTPVTNRFTYGLDDVASATLVGGGQRLAGSIMFGSKTSEGGTVTIGGFDFGGLSVDFSADEASGFCFGFDPNCVFGGGTSTEITAEAVSAIPLPASLPLILAAAVALGLARRRPTPAA